MSKESTSAAFIESANQMASLDRGGDTKGARYRFAVTGTALGTHARDQASFFAVETDPVVDATHILATIASTSPRFSNAQIGTYIAFNPAQVRNANFTDCNSPAALASLEIHPVRYDPSGDNQQEVIAASDFQNASDFQSNRVQIPLDLVCDGYSFLRVVSDPQIAAVTYKVAFLFGARFDRRLDVPDQGPAVIRTSSK